MVTFGIAETVVMSGEDAPRPYPENLIVLEIKTNKQTMIPSKASNYPVLKQQLRKKRTRKRTSC
jgi:hypothetical protein